ncbi:MBL fold metallo-hydrolase [Aestuariirhabdus litorea]|uniref:MBL fold metallo-hydrolase n=1 Tax=Aestuariirhabdus litorea TaxID=2528527 RepID=A0A3P3VPS0_9GAMM|nr:MBL fold metallo-hydrolase [Aestuariirhabdus litorea]RRJ84772.1 MBL fold metallo-hydrolase [Aestuariirhabdus litorea]RWW97996.1 MBL fold metallo-hydrolase [Endozoicomonadaceae bacterium GTF-13]
MALAYRVVPVTPFQQNCSVIWCDQTLKAAVVDPGGDLDRVMAVLEKEGLTLEKILLTHGHVDHVAGTDELKRKSGVPVIGPHQADLFWIQMLPDICKQYGFPPALSFAPDQWLNDGDSVALGNETLEVIHTPGHTPGHVIFFHPGQSLAWVGDVLFQGSIGRTDFPQGDYDTLISSIRERLWPLGEGVTFVPGHGPNSTFGQERRSNPFVADQAFQ